MRAPPFLSAFHLCTFHFLTAPHSSSPLYRQLIEDFLQELIPDCYCPLDLPEALVDGVVLCKVVNRLEPGYVPQIHAEPDRAKVGTSLRVRKNVESFLEFCRKVGISAKKMCSALDILQQKETATLVWMLEHLIKGGHDGGQIAFV